MGRRDREIGYHLNGGRQCWNEDTEILVWLPPNLSQTPTGKSPMEVLNQRKMRSRLDLLHPSLQEKVHKKQTQMRETHDRKGHERKFTPGERECVIVYVKNFGPRLKTLIGMLIYVTGSGSYAVALHRPCLRRRSGRQLVETLKRRKVTLVAFHEAAL